jgi:hypothetical protein
VREVVAMRRLKSGNREDVKAAFPEEFRVYSRNMTRLPAQRFTRTLLGFPNPRGVYLCPAGNRGWIKKICFLTRGKISGHPGSFPSLALVKEICFPPKCKTKLVNVQVKESVVTIKGLLSYQLRKDWTYFFDGDHSSKSVSAPFQVS